jgi:hypothetical protein
VQSEWYWEALIKRLCWLVRMKVTLRVSMCYSQKKGSESVLARVDDVPEAHMLFVELLS